VNNDTVMEIKESVIVGDLTNYELSFKTTIYLVKGSWLRLEFPIEFRSFGDTKCYLRAENHELDCKIIDGVTLIVAPLPVDIRPGLQGLKIMNIYNPYFKGRTSMFIFETLMAGTNTVVEYYEILGVDIKTGDIKNTFVYAASYARSQYNEYTISFEPTNLIPQGGYIDLVFPSTFQMLAPSCRIIQGPSQIDSNTLLSCISIGKSVRISNFTAFSPQSIILKIFARNPEESGITQHFQIMTFKEINKILYIIDENKLSGQINIQSIEKPYFLKVDMFKIYTNISLGQTGPIDFRLFPSSGNVLPITRAQTSGEIYFMIPLWWSNNGVNIGIDTIGINPICKFGASSSSACSYGKTDGIQIYRINTPSTEDILNRYTNSTQDNPTGLGECDLPISVMSSKITPIPGRYNFRVLTFKDSTYSTFTAEPLDQGMYSMDIPVEPFPGNPIVYTTSEEESDPDNIIRVEFQVGLDIPWEGAINLNFTTQKNIYEHSSAWPFDLGFSIQYPEFKRIPCRLKVGSNVVGHSGAAEHRLVKCFIYAGSSKNNAIIQVYGFSQTIPSNTLVEVDIPNVKLCSQSKMYCFIELTTAYTTERLKPYTLNYFKTSVAYIKGAKVRTTPEPSKLVTFSATFSPSEICLLTIWTFKFDLQEKISVNDHVVIKMQSKPFPFLYDGAKSNLGRVDIIYNDIGSVYELYYVIKATKILPQGRARSLTLSDVRNSNFVSPDDPASNLAYPLNHFPVIFFKS
jgi:hypothetical protein